jgi:uncharacterized protein (DUF2141 family)
MKWFITLLAMLVAAGTLLAQPAAVPGRGRILVKIDGFKSDDGQVRVYLFNDAGAFPSKKDKAVAVIKDKIHDRHAEITFDNIPFGTYAVSVHHDVNGNDKIDHNWMHIPKEPYGASNGARNTFGPPKFKQAKFEHAAEITTISITVK